MGEMVVIPKRFKGPPDSGHGGYTCGVFAGLVGDTAEITLRTPPPLDTPMAVDRPDDISAVIRDGDTVVGEVRVAALDLKVPKSPSLGEAEAAERRFYGFGHHLFPDCFGCGHRRAAGDGLRILTGPVAGRDIVAAPWTPHQSLGDGDGRVGREFQWAALDCASGWALLGPGEGPILLGRFTGQVHKGLRVGEPCIVIGWPVARDGRKLFAGSALFSASGRMWAAGKATWIVP